MDIPFGHNNHSAMDIGMNLFKGPLSPNLPYLLSFSMILLQFENLCIQYSSFGMKMNLIISDVIVLLMDQVSNTRTTKNLLALLTIIMSKALMFLNVEFKKRILLEIYSHLSTVPTRFLPLTVSVIVRVRGKLVRLELEETC